MQGTLLNINPLVAVFDDVFTADEALAVINAGKDDLDVAKYGTREGITTGEKRTNLAAFINQWEFPAISEIVNRLSSIVRLPPENSEKVKVLKYEPDQIFDVHSDGFEDHPTYAKYWEQGGQRLFTTLCYLNDVEEEGQTAFPALKIAVRPKLGRVLLFSNTIPGTVTPFDDARHVGFGPKDGEKWVLSVWWRERNYHEPRIFPETDGEFREF